jgi:hypothetical protein
VGAVLLGWILCGAALAEGMERADFSADMISKSQGREMEMKIYVTKDKTRMDMGQSMVITRMDKHVSWMVMPSQNMYMENPIDLDKVAKTEKTIPGEVERVSLGADAVDGQQAEKFKITYITAGRQDSMYQWMAGNSPVPLKMEAADGSWSMQYKNVRLGPQPDSLFEIPAGCQKFAMPAGMGGAPMQMPADPGADSNQ